MTAEIHPFATDARLKLIRERLAARSPDLKSGDGDGTPGGMDPWQQTVETRLGELRADVRTLLYWTIGAFAGVIGAIGAVYLHMDSKFDTLTALINTLPKH